MSKNALALTGRNEKYSHIFKEENIERDHHIMTSEEQFAAEQEASRLLFANIFGLDDNTSSDEIISFFSKQHEEVVKANGAAGEAVPESELRIMSDEQRQKEFEESQHVYKRNRAEAKGLTDPEWSTSTDKVVGASNSTGSLFDRSRETLRNTSSGSTTSSTTGRSKMDDYASGPSTQNTTGKPRPAIDEFQRMNNSIQRVSGQRPRAWSEKAKISDDEYFAQFSSSVPWWKRQLRKGKTFLKSGKGRITSKMAIVILLQMGMAVYGKKYEFESKQQMFGMFTLMLASFFMSRELSEDGLDVSGMIF